MRGAIGLLSLTSRTKMKTFAEQIVAVEATKAAKAARMSDIMQKSLDENRTSDTGEAEEFDTLEGEIKKIDEELVRLRKMERIQAANAQPVIDKANDVSNSIIR